MIIRFNCGLVSLHGYTGTGTVAMQADWQYYSPDSPVKVNTPMVKKVMNTDTLCFTPIVAQVTLGPNSLIISFSSGRFPTHHAGGRVLPLF